MVSEMSDMPTESGAFLAVKTLGAKAVMGMIGATLLYAVMPPLNSDGTFNRSEFIVRLACAGVCSMVFGQWGVDLFTEFFPRLGAEKHPAAVFLLTGAPAWWVSRWAAVWLHKRKDKDLGEVYDEVKGRS